MIIETTQIEPVEASRIAGRFDLTSDEFKRLNAQNITISYLRHNVLNTATKLVAVSQKTDMSTVNPIEVSYSFRLIDENNRLSIFYIEISRDSKKMNMYLSSGRDVLKLSILDLFRLHIEVRHFILSVVYSFDESEIIWKYLAVINTAIDEERINLVPLEVSTNRLASTCNCNNSCKCAIDYLTNLFEVTLIEMLEFEGKNIDVPLKSNIIYNQRSN